ncbi:MAG: primosomal protein N' [Candidatus Aminicenantes bacterium]|nr:primosomal protein N' [Candidatus Aminicenantes bacterium]
MSRFVDVVFPRPLLHSLTYLKPEGFPRLAEGQRVSAPLGKRTVSGFVVREHDESPAGGVELKPLASVVDPAPLIAPPVLAFTKRLAAYHLSPWGEMLAFALPPSGRIPGRGRPRPRTPASPQLSLDFASGPAVAGAAEAVSEKAAAGGFAPFLAWGGDEERLSLYRRILRSPAVRTGGVLVLVPEVDEMGAAREWAEADPERPAVLVHGRLTARAKAEAWSSVRAGRTPVVVGSRAALFGPIPGLRLVIVDDEPHAAFLQTESPVFDVRQGAWLRASAEGAVLIYGAEHPSVAGLAKARDGGYLHRLGRSAAGPRVVLADDGRSRDLLSPALEGGLRRTLAARGRSIVFLNRRGYASLVFCPACGFIPSCRKCGARPSYHKREDRLVCHACGAAAVRPASCPDCGGRVLEPRGVGLEAIEEELRRLLPGARLARFDRDLAGRSSDRERILKSFEAGKIDVLLGTELLARRAGVRRAEFVGLLNPEAWLAFPDFTASERAFQSVRRMLRFARPGDGEAVIQTGFPDHYSLRAAALGDEDAFYAAELENRRLLGHPPFSSAAEIVIFGREARALGRRARALASRLAASPEGPEVIGPAIVSAPGGKGTKKIQIVLRADRSETITEVLGRALPRLGGAWRVTRWS